MDGEPGVNASNLHEEAKQRYDCFQFNFRAKEWVYFAWSDVPFWFRDLVSIGCREEVKTLSAQRHRYLWKAERHRTVEA